VEKNSISALPDGVTELRLQYELLPASAKSSIL
jgi:hypothetical protein